MDRYQKVHNTIDEYIADFPEDAKNTPGTAGSHQSRRTDAQEAIKYQIPTFTLNGNLIHFGAFQRHIGFYPAPRGIPALKKSYSKYEGGRGTVKFPIDKPLPYELIAKT